MRWVAFKLERLCADIAPVSHVDTEALDAVQIEELTTVCDGDDHFHPQQLAHS